MTGSHPAHPDCIHSRCGVRVARIVMHVTEGDSLSGCVSWFQQPAGGARGNSPTAAHYIIGPAGEIVQMVGDDMACWHAGNYAVNLESIGIEVVGWTGKTVFPEVQLQAAARVVAILCRKFAIPVDRAHVIGHSEVPRATHHDPGSTWPWGDFMAMVAVG